MNLPVFLQLYFYRYLVCGCVITYITVDSTITGVGKYAYDIYNLMKPESSIIQMIFNKKYMDKRYKNPVMGTKFPLLNYSLSNIVYRDIIKNVNSIEGIVHITSQTMKPVFNSKHMVVTVHDIMASQNNIKPSSLQEALKKKYMNEYLKVYMKYENIITVSNVVKSQILETFNINDDKVSVIPPFIPDYFYRIENKNKLREKLGLPKNKILILSVSSNQPRKNLGMVKRVVEALGNNYLLVRIGTPVGNSITFNNVDEVTLNEIYNACDLLYFPTLMEGFGYPVIEAFKTGLPVVSSDIDIIREVSSGAAVLVDPENMQENIKAINTIMDGKDSLVEMGYNISKKYSKYNVKQRLVNYYNGILDGSVHNKTY